MELSLLGAGFVRSHEGFVPRWYLDPVDVGTIGVGFTWASGSFRVWWAKNKPGVKFGPGATMTRAEADQCLVFLCREEYGKAVNKFMGKQVDQHVFDGMVSPVYNLGPGSLGWKWAGFIRAGDIAAGATALMTTGTTAKNAATGTRKTLPGLVRRRKEEADLIQYGKYAGAVDMPVADAMANAVLMRGERGPAVKALLIDLEKLDYYDGLLDDVYGLGAEAAVLAFQRANGLQADGFAGPKTLAAIAKAVAVITPQPSIPKPSEPAKPDPVTTPGRGFWAWLLSFFR